jgi:hypothetical protein
MKHVSSLCSSKAVVESLSLPVLARLQSEAGTPFKLEQGPLVRALMVKLGSEDHLLMLTMHHAICDGCSFGVCSPAVSHTHLWHLASFTMHFCTSAYPLYDTLQLYLRTCPICPLGLASVMHLH